MLGAAADAVVETKVSNNKRYGDRNDYVNGVQKRRNACMRYCRHKDSIAVVRSVDGMPHILMDFMPLGRVVLALFPYLLTMIIVKCQGRLLVSQLAL